jgi:hypothetical protein
MRAKEVEKFKERQAAKTAARETLRQAPETVRFASSMFDGLPRYSELSFLTTIADVVTLANSKGSDTSGRAQKPPNRGE